MMRHLALFMALILSVATAHAEPSKLTLGMNLGIETRTPLEVLKTAYAKLGIEIDGKAFPARRSLSEANQGHTDGEVIRIAAIEHQNPNLIKVAVPIDNFTVIAITNNPDISINSTQDLTPYRVGIRAGILFAERATAQLPDVVKLADWDTLFDLLAMGRLDVVISTPLTWHHQMQRDNLDQLHVLQPPLDTINLYHYLHKKHADLVPAITKVLQKMQANGEKDRIHEQRNKKRLNSKQK